MIFRKSEPFNTITVGRPKNLPKKGDAKHYQKGIMKDGTRVFWYYSLNEVPHNFSCFLAHEFFDALPVHKFKVSKMTVCLINFPHFETTYTNYFCFFQKTPEGWREILVTTDPEKGLDSFKFVISRSGTPSSKIFMKVKEYLLLQNVTHDNKKSLD